MNAPLVPGVHTSHACTYVIGNRKQRWALLGGEVEGLCGETAISVRLAFVPKQHQTVVEADTNNNQNDIQNARASFNTTSVRNSETTEVDSDKSKDSIAKKIKSEDIFVPHLGSFRRHCNVCKQPYVVLHPFYHQLCGRCGDFNLEKRLQTADLSG